MIRDFKFDSKIKPTRRLFPRLSGKLLALLFFVFATGLATALLNSSPEQPHIARIQDNPIQRQALQLPVMTKVSLSGTSSLPPISTIPTAKPVALQTSFRPVTTTPQKPPAQAKPAPVVEVTKEITPDTNTLPVMQAKDKWITHEVRSGESLATIFKKQQLSPSLLHKITHSSKTAKKLAHIKPGETLRFRFIEEKNELKQLILEKNPVESLVITKDSDSFQAKEIERELETKIASASGIIQSSLFIDGQAAGLTDAQIMELASIFGWDIDFALELRKGDHFSLIYEERYLDGKKYDNGPILAAEFTNRGKTWEAIRYKDQNDVVSYYDAEGRNKKRAFIRTPVKFSRISSKFTRKRWHPVLKKWRSHKGVDYAAPRGTPIKAAGAGKVIFKGRKGGYGKAVFLRHGSKYTTVYGHLSSYNRKIKKGRTVKQGQIIGYVGSTGLASGPHLHYEFRVNGVHKNPLTIKLPKSLPLPKKQLKNFKKTSTPLLASLKKISNTILLAARPDE